MIRSAIKIRDAELDLVILMTLQYFWPDLKSDFTAAGFSAHEHYHHAHSGKNGNSVCRSKPVTIEYREVVCLAVDNSAGVFVRVCLLKQLPHSEYTKDLDTYLCFCIRLLMCNSFVFSILARYDKTLLK